MTMTPTALPLTFASYQDFITRGHDGDREHQALALLGEVGELANKVKKVRYYGQPLNIPDLIDEAGDVLAYAALSAAVWGYRLSVLAGCDAFASLEASVAAQFRRQAEPLHIHVLRLGRELIAIVDAVLDPDPYTDNVAMALNGILRRLALVSHALGVPFEDMARANMAKVGERFPERAAASVEGQ